MPDATPVATEAAPVVPPPAPPETPAPPAADAKPADAKVEAKPVDAKVEEKKPEEKKPEGEIKDLADRFAALAKKEADLFKSQKVHKANEAAAKEYEAFKAAVAANPIEALSKLGVPLDALEAALAAAKSTDPAVKTARELAELKKSLEAKEQAAKQEAEQRAAATRLAQFRKEIDDFVAANAEKYELIHAAGAGGLVQQAITRHYQKTSAEGAPKILSHAEACDLVEKYLEDSQAPLLKTKKIASKFAPPAPPAKAEEKKPAAPQKTLDNDATRSGTEAEPPPPPNETDDERIARIAKKWEKKAALKGASA